MKPLFPDGARFAFTIFDDTDDATVANVKPVYDLLAECGLRTTKSVWVYPPQTSAFSGECLQDPSYLEWILDLQALGFEIALHNVGDGFHPRSEILAGLDEFRDRIGAYPRAHANHASNPDCLYWWDRRVEAPLTWGYRLAYRIQKGKVERFPGDDPASPCYWGDAAKQHITYMRNLTFNGINTLRSDPRMPYSVKHKSRSSNLWFSGSDGYNKRLFVDLLSPGNLEALEREQGACIVYTHFAKDFVGESGRVDPQVEARIRDLASRPGWFAPVSEVLDHLALSGGTDDPGYLYRIRLNARWILDRYRKLRAHGA